MATTETINGHFTCDNSYAVYLGDANGVVTKVLPVGTADGITNTLAQDILQGEDVTFEAKVGDYFYIIAWSDDSGYQGLLGEFSGTQTIFTGNAAWEVFPTGKNYDNNQAPTAAIINSFVTQANTNNSWVAPYVGPTNANTTQIYTSAAAGTKIQNVHNDANWVWYNSGNDTSKGAPFSGFNHGEFLIFRIPVWEMAPELDPENVDPAPAPTPAPTPAPAQACCCHSQPQTLICQQVTKRDKFDVYISRIRLAKSSGREGRAEVMLTGYANGKMAVMPSTGMQMTIYTNWGWRMVNRYIETVKVKEDQTLEVPLHAEVFGYVGAVARAGTSQKISNLKLKSGVPTEPQVLTVECLDPRGGQNSDQTFVLEVEFIAYER